jgi:hypothetical protein
MQLMFMQEFHVVNQSGEAVRITPVGIMEDRDTRERGVLPQFMSKIPALPSIKSRSFTLHLEINVVRLRLGRHTVFGSPRHQRKKSGISTCC